MYYDFLQVQLKGFVIMTAMAAAPLGIPLNEGLGNRANIVVRPGIQTADYTEYAPQ